MQAMTARDTMYDLIAEISKHLPRRRLNLPRPNMVYHEENVVTLAGDHVFTYGVFPADSGEFFILKVKDEDTGEDDVICVSRHAGSSLRISRTMGGALFTYARSNNRGMSQRFIFDDDVLRDRLMKLVTTGKLTTGHALVPNLVYFGETKHLSLRRS